jgi:hypothetical protein
MTPMNPANSTTSAPRWRARHYIAVTLLLALVMGVFVVWGFFRLGSETETLRESLMSSTQEKWNKKIALHVGIFSTTLVRAGSLFFTIPSEPRAALDAVRGVEFGVYELAEEPVCLNSAAILAKADRAMAARGWDRAVGVAHENEVVALYVPRRGGGTRNVRCCLFVLERRNLVVLSAKANIEPLLQLAQQRLAPAWREQHFRWDSAQPVWRNNSNPKGNKANVVASNIP